jgi:hypothetical protein
MSYSSRPHSPRPSAGLCLLLAALALIAGRDTVRAAELPYQYEFGYRYGYDDGEPRAEMEQQEIFVHRALPWAWRAPGESTLGTLAVGSAGALYDPGDSTAFIGQLGFGLVWLGASQRLSADAGLTVNYISKHRFDELDLGGPIEFTSHIGARLDLVRNLGVTYRFQHQSNGILYDRNPGLNMHMFGISRRF